MKLTTPVKTALAIFGLLAVYFGIRTVLSGAEKAPAVEAEAALFPVLATTVASEEWRDEVLVRGRTEALRKITVRAETPGIVEATPVEPGTPVAADAPLCRLKIDARRAGLAESRAALAKARLDHNAAVELAKAGFRSEAAVATAKAALDLAKASVEQSNVAVGKTEIAAPWAGIFDERLAEIGDFLNVGDPCGVLIQQDPFLVVGAVSERDVAKITAGDRGVARLATGETLEGKVRFVSSAADAQTRTFEVQLEAPNPGGALRDGVTAEFTVYAERRQAHRVPRSALTLGDDGKIGLRLVAAGDVVKFAEVALLGESADGVYVSGLEGTARVITRGQDFVTEGQRVAVTADEGAAGAEG